MIRKIILSNARIQIGLKQSFTIGVVIGMTKLLNSLISLLLALFVGGILIAVTGGSPFATYWTMLTSCFGSLRGLMGVLAYATPLLFTGLGAAMAFQGSVFNAGGEGQLCVGGLAAALVGIYCDVSWPVGLILALAAAFVAGGLWAFIPTWMVGKYTQALVVGTIMMNSIGALFAQYLVRHYFLREGSTMNETETILSGAVLPRFSSKTQLNFGVLIGLMMVLVVAWIIYRTPFGFALRAMGQNPHAAQQAGIQTFRTSLQAMFISGGLCGLAGAVQCLAIYTRFIEGFSPGYGWDGLTVSALATHNPFAIIVTAILFGMLRSASISLTLSKSVSVDMILILQGLIVMFVATPFLRYVIENLVRKPVSAFSVWRKAAAGKEVR